MREQQDIADAALIGEQHRQPIDAHAPPDLVLYLRASVGTLLGRIMQRGRDYERKITPEYLGQLNALYEAWINGFSLCPVLTVPADDLDYVAHSGHLDLIVRKVEEKLTGKEEVVFDPEEVANCRRG